jgi:predicted helicase
VITTDDLVKVTSFETLVKVLRDQLEWPIPEDYEFGDVTYEYEAKELGLKPDQIAKIREVHQLRPLTTNQPWGIFFVSFEDKGLPVTVMRRILRSLVLTKRADAKDANRAAWQRNDLLFISAHGLGGARELSFAHFADGKETGDLPVLRVLNWNRDDTVSHNQYVTEMLNRRLHWPEDPNDLGAWRASWAGAFEIGYQETIRTSKDMSVSLAALARQIRKRANELLSAEADSGSMRQLHKAFRENLIKDLSEDDFADMFAQTISYGLLAARISRPEGLVVDNLSDMIPPTNPFLKELFATFLKLGGRDKRKDLDFDELGVRDVVEMLNRANMEAVLRDFGDRNPKDDPVIHFYELFLREYDAQKRMQRGVFYTPRPVVGFIVRGVDEVLRTEFGLPLGLADTTTWGELAARNSNITVPDHVDSSQPFVQILDPATGTGTFLVEVVDLIHKRMVETWQAAGKRKAEIDALWRAYVPKHLLPRLTAFELMMAPYAIAHMKLGLKLFETGYRFEEDVRARIFLTNALEPARDLDLEFIFMSEALAHEAMAANDAKSRTHFTVVIGNPPYAGISSNMTAHAKALVDRYRYLEGVRLDERKLWIQDDYVKFFAFSQATIAAAGFGVLGLITNHGYLDNVTFRGFRADVLKTLNRMWLCDLHGNINKNETGVLGVQDENVFDIRQGVSIAIGAAGPPGEAVKFLELWGTREEKAARLMQLDLLSKEFSPIRPSSDAFLFKPVQDALLHEYGSGISVDDLIAINGLGFQSSRDHLVVDFDKDVLAGRIADFASTKKSDDHVRNQFFPGKKVAAYEPGDTRQWSVSAARRYLNADQRWRDNIRPCLYRPFDWRFILYDKRMVDWPRPEVLGQMLSANLCLIANRQSKEAFAVLVADVITERKIAAVYDASTTFPLWVQPSGADPYRRPNLNAGCARGFGKKAGLTYDDGSPKGQTDLGADYREQATPQLDIWDGRGDLKTRFGPQDLFDWVYAVLHSPAYRARYAEFLKSDFPRLPRPGSRALFAALARIGRELVGLHLLRTDGAKAFVAMEVRFAGAGEARVAKGFPKFENGKVMINASRWFEDVPRETWDFRIGGYQVLEKWLKDRAATGGKTPSPGRVLSEEDILHYRRVVVALTETRRLMVEIDRVIDQHGGWPGAFAGNTE